MAFGFQTELPMDQMTSENVNGKASADSVHSVEKPLPNSRRIYAGGKLHPDVRVPFREITLAPTKSMNGEIEINVPVRVYDTSGPWGDPDFHGDVTQGIPPLRSKWIRERRDVEIIAGRVVTPVDDGYLSMTHAQQARRSNGNSKLQPPDPEKTRSFRLENPNFSRRKILRAKSHPVTQLYYAKKGVITPEMEFIAIRENLGREPVADVSDRRNGKDRHSENAATKEFLRNDLRFRHSGSQPIANHKSQILNLITPEFVRSEV